MELSHEFIGKLNQDITKFSKDHFNTTFYDYQSQLAFDILRINEKYQKNSYSSEEVFLHIEKSMEIFCKVMENRTSIKSTYNKLVRVKKEFENLKVLQNIPPEITKKFKKDYRKTVNKPNKIIQESSINQFQSLKRIEIPAVPRNVNTPLYILKKQVIDYTIIVQLKYLVRKLLNASFVIQNFMRRPVTLPPVQYKQSQGS